ncbi:SH3 domain-containing protein [Oscillatoria salina]|uniref:SH3 domain-containing protein n=1 Tax=Oscillatoria salina TaxID=331517 RepID=UPI0013BA74CB|nr:SH3 domain-containing protein [Oscillatoria salina]MBZ8179403.1 SH3 domain-containing protein [Oscillatoria salina IIICB1]NET87858.1 SH3 domain-containing protein [Kamptonema sp. SIO1D9]
MKHIKNKISALTALSSLSFAALSFSFPAKAKEITTSSNYLEKQEQIQVAQAGSCYEVSARGSGLYVRQEPSVYSQSLGVLNDGRNVTVIGNVSNNDWVQISAPVPGYVFGGFLESCQSSPVATNINTPNFNSCRRVLAQPGLNIRQEPSINSPILGRLAYNRNVGIDNLGRNGWVEISTPVEGYISADYLGYCR